MYKILGTAGAVIAALSVAGWTVSSRAQQDPPPPQGGTASQAGEKLDDLGRAFDGRSPMPRTRSVRG